MAVSAFTSSVMDLMPYQQTFLLAPSTWATFTNTHNLIWKSVKFEKASKGSVPKTRGVYAFVVSPGLTGVPPIGYLMYIGETGDSTTGTASLRTRFLQYFREQAVKKREAVHVFLNKWADHLLFYFAEIPTPSVSTKAVEESLCDALRPPVVTQDFSPAVRSQTRALRAT